MTQNINVRKTSPKLLCEYRRRKSSVTEPRTILEHAHSDRGRIMFCASFRRLAQKTQVFALSLDGARTRLTHSLEVAHIGAYIVDKIFKNLDKEKKTSHAEISTWKGYGWIERQAIRTFVEVSCLVHDIGNPPFGHFGEKAICNWFNSHSDSEWYKNAVDRDAFENDFVGFDGNKQGFRILTKLQRNGGDGFGLNLTATQLASTIKYPILDKSKPTKCSYFQSEKTIKDEVWRKLNLNDGQRHPLSLLMEAADDIAYCVSDLEDAAERGLVTTNDLERAFGKRKGSFKQPLSVGMTELRTGLTNSLVELVANEFIERLRQNTQYEKQPIFNSNVNLDKLRSITEEKVYSSREVLSNEITGFKVIQSLLDSFVPLLEMEEDNFRKLAKAFEDRRSIYTSDLKSIIKRSTPEPSLFSLLPRKHLAVYRDATSSPDYQEPEKFHRAHLIVDFVAGMTDDFALSTYRLLSGQVTHGNQ